MHGMGPLRIAKNDLKRANTVLKVFCSLRNKIKVNTEQSHQNAFRGAEMCLREVGAVLQSFFTSKSKGVPAAKAAASESSSGGRGAME